MKRCWYHNEYTHTIQNCLTFASLDVKDKFELINKYGACYCCLKLGHISKNCLERVTCIMGNNKVCGRFHHPLIHTSSRPINSSKICLREITILPADLQ